MHRQFRLQNILLHQGICKINDGFMMQTEMKKVFSSERIGTSLTMPPEWLKQQNCGIETEIWSIGVFYYQLLYGKYPFMGLNDYAILKKIESSKVDFSEVNISENAQNFIERCLTILPAKRINWTEIYQHPLIKSQQKIPNKMVQTVNSIEAQKQKNFLNKQQSSQKIMTQLKKQRKQLQNQIKETRQRIQLYTIQKAAHERHNSLESKNTAINYKEEILFLIVQSNQQAKRLFTVTKKLREIALKAQLTNPNIQSTTENEALAFKKVEDSYH